MEAMDLNSKLFDRIRVKPARKQAVQQTSQVRCDHPGCNEPAPHRAPMGRLREGQYFSFCLDHVKEYNASYNYFNGMSAEDVAVYQKEDTVGHRPTWSMGSNRSRKGFREEGDDPSQTSDPLGLFRSRMPPGAEPPAPKPRYGVAILKALEQLGLDDTVDAVAVKTRYKELVKRLHPDANGGDRSNEDKLREIIRAYNYLKSVKLA
jgi:curved DNA-binding protein CbpA